MALFSRELKFGIGLGMACNVVRGAGVMGSAKVMFDHHVSEIPARPASMQGHNFLRPELAAGWRAFGAFQAPGPDVENR